MTQIKEATINISEVQLDHYIQDIRNETNLNLKAEKISQIQVVIQNLYSKYESLLSNN